MTEVEPLAAGQAALEAGRWQEARAAFAAALASGPTPEALDGMGWPSGGWARPGPAWPTPSGPTPATGGPGTPRPRPR